MAILEQPLSKQQVVLLATHVFGRNPLTVNTIIKADDVSQIHASISWQSDKWYLRDHSRNGTWVNDQLIGNENFIEIKTGDGIRFGYEDTSVWTLIDESVPASAFTNTLEFSIRELRDFLFEFTVSLDEEHVMLKLFHNKKRIDLGECVHHYLLLLLARQRLADADKGIDEANQGWIDFELFCRITGLDESHLNIQIFRIRNQLAKALNTTRNVADIIERRRGVVRIGATQFRILQGGMNKNHVAMIPPGNIGQALYSVQY